MKGALLCPACVPSLVGSFGVTGGSARISDLFSLRTLTWKQVAGSVSLSDRLLPHTSSLLTMSHAVGIGRATGPMDANTNTIPVEGEKPWGLFLTC